VQVAQHPAGDLELAFGRAVGEVVDGGERVAEVFAEADAVLRDANEDEASVGFGFQLGKAIVLNRGGIPVF
jgi:hypothetical protein